ncbi:MAG: prepilin peptidase [Candidatus Aenigmatarchaeota archaeon]
MIEFVIAFLAYLVAGLLDLKTTEFPNWIPYSLIASILAINIIRSFSIPDISIFIGSLTFGMIFLAAGLLLYAARAWGDGDAWLFGSLGFIFYFSPLKILIVFSITALIYTILYSFYIGLRNDKVLKAFKKEIRTKRNVLCIIFSVFTLFSIFTYNLLKQPIIIFLPLFILFILFYIPFALHVERICFRKRIHVSELTMNHIPIKSLLRNMKPEELERLKKRNGYIWVKEGIRFSPVFFLTLLFTLV